MTELFYYLTANFSPFYSLIQGYAWELFQFYSVIIIIASTMNNYLAFDNKCQNGDPIYESMFDVDRFERYGSSYLCLGIATFDIMVLFVSTVNYLITSRFMIFNRILFCIVNYLAFLSSGYVIGYKTLSPKYAYTGWYKDDTYSHPDVSMIFGITFLCTSVLASATVF